jgi:hypothetical protein
MKIEPKNTPLYKYRLYDFSRPEGKEIIGGVVQLTLFEVNTKNRAFRMNHAQKKYIKEIN